MVLWSLVKSPNQVRFRRSRPKQTLVDLIIWFYPLSYYYWPITINNICCSIDCSTSQVFWSYVSTKQGFVSSKATHMVSKVALL